MMLENGGERMAIFIWTLVAAAAVIVVVLILGMT